MANSESSRREPTISAVPEQPHTTQVYPMNQFGGVVITDINIPFGRVVSIMVKWILASIPAVILAAIIVYALSFLFFLIFGAPFWTE